MAGEHAYQTATVLKDGKVLFAGGYLSSGFSKQAALITSEVYDPATHRFHETGHMTIFRADGSAVRLADGRVLVTGGFDQGRYLTSVGRSALKTAEIFDPGSETFTATASMQRAQYGHQSLLLSNGKVLIAGGACEAEAAGNLLARVACPPELYDPTTSTFSIADPFAPHNEEEATALSDGRALLFCGGTMAEIYDPKTGKFVHRADMTPRLDMCSGTLLADGRVFILGSKSFIGTMNEAPKWQALLYDPNANSYSPLPDLPLDLPFPVAALDGAGKVLISGDVPPDYDNVLSSEIFDPNSNQFSVIGSVPPHRDGFTSTTLNDGTILIAGGSKDSLPYNIRPTLLFCP